MHPNSMKLMEYFRDKYVDKKMSILDVGSRQYGGQPTYRDIFVGYNYTGMDVESGENVDIVGYNCITGLYDVVVSGQVLEHVERPWLWMKQVATLTRNLICIIAPNKCRFHRVPVDTFRYLPDGMRVLFVDAHITELEIFMDGHDTIGIGKVDYQNEDI